MKKLTSSCIILTICFVATIIGCKKSGIPVYHAPGVITQVGGCCPGCYCAAFYGGYYSIKFNGDTATSYTITNDLSKFGIDSSTKFPVKVIVNWQPDEAIKGGNNIIITQLKIIN